jgi:hypothetical protein
VGAAGYYFIFDSLWRRTESAVAGLRDVQRQLPGSTLVHVPVRPEVFDGLEDTLKGFRLDAAVRVVRRGVEEVRARAGAV